MQRPRQPEYLPPYTPSSDQPPPPPPPDDPTRREGDLHAIASPPYTLELPGSVNPGVAHSDSEVEARVGAASGTPSGDRHAGYSIGMVVTPGPLVDLLHVKGHLAILRALGELKDRVREMDVEVSVGKGEGAKDVFVLKEKEKRWGWFVALAVERYVYVAWFSYEF